MANKEYISDELLAAYLEGNTNEAETHEVLNALKANPELQEMLDIALQVEDETTRIIDLPMMQVAALSGENICAVRCEMYILHRRRVPYDEEWLLNTARRKDWLKPEGTPLYCLGNLLAYSGLLVSRKYNSTIDDIQHALDLDNDVVVGVDREKLYAEDVDLEDLTNHAVVVTHIEGDYVTVFDPYVEPYISRILMSDFLLAWKESHNYMIQILQSVEEYVPHPIDVDNIPLDGDLGELQEAIAENAHDVWAEARIKEGWTYGEERDDTNKKHPDLVPYTALSEKEKDYDRKMAFNTIKLVKKLGFEIIKRNDKGDMSVQVEQNKSGEDANYITGLTFSSDERGILCHGHSLLEKLSVHPIGEGMQWIGNSHGPLFFANYFTGKARQLLDENSHLVGFGDQDFDWEKLKKVEHSHDLNHRYVDYGGLGRYDDFRDGVCCLCWMLYPDGRYFADEDGFGMEDNDEENIYCIIDKNLHIVIPWQPMTDEEMAMNMREAKRKVAGK